MNTDHCKTSQNNEADQLLLLKNKTKHKTTKQKTTLPKNTPMDDFGYKKTKELEDETTEPEYNNLQANLKTEEFVADLLMTLYAMDKLGLWTPNSFLFGQVKFCRKNV